MKEDFLHYVWKFQKFDARALQTTSGTSLQIIQAGIHNFNSGPDFFNAQIRIGDQHWAGTVEIHVKASDWYVHNHEQDAQYDTVILHVVYEHDAEIIRNDGTFIPTLEIGSLISSEAKNYYSNLFLKPHTWINCEHDIQQVDGFILKNWQDRMFIERLEQKTERIKKEAERCSNHWEEVLFRLLCKNFGQKVNGEAFLSMAQATHFKTVQKCRGEVFVLEALLFGQAGLLHDLKEDGYYRSLQKEYRYLKQKFQLENNTVITPKFFRLRPSNFPTIRLSQLGVLYSKTKGLFSEILSATTRSEYYEIFAVSAGEYWDTHFNFGTVSSPRKKKLTENTVDLLLLNTVIPLKFYYYRTHGKDVSEEMMTLAAEIKPEVNAVLKKFGDLGVKANSAFESQSLLQLKKQYCDVNRCLECAVGNSLLKQKI
ncbi:DUF2851 family protein [Cochleicola gelatinilyticus]|uniref:DUF2851 domain-containing protein n=1 Tax=Cochleicola gelatinilyticus TaxID=1763537 RepID=A0A167KDR1_9FLAO|nr:DUF2851 family protein [Cochleicola gelatinilyticus]OAB81785.1 hypothetical protein ULVI_00135 [Cochleicola gelatinilyticus]